MKRLGFSIVIVFLLLSSFGVGFISSCTHSPEFISDFDTICFEKQILPILQTSCAMAGCHSENEGEGGFAATGYVSILSVVTPGSALKSKLYRSISAVYGGNVMPPDRALSQSQRNLILVWIEQGAMNTACSGKDLDTTGHTANNPDTVCFEQDVLPLLYSRCASTGCHDALTAKEGYIFTDYAHIIAGEEAVVPFNTKESKLYKTINGTGEKLMPPSPRESMSAHEKEIIGKWINQGAVNSNCQLAACDTSATISFSKQIMPAIQSSCVGCHNAISYKGGVNLGDYGHIYTYATTLRNNTPVFLGAIKQMPGFKAMPPGVKLSGCNLRQIEKWMSQGALNN